MFVLGIFMMMMMMVKAFYDYDSSWQTSYSPEKYFLN